jgi:hypothetical protein
MLGHLTATLSVVNNQEILGEGERSVQFTYF